MMSFAYDCFLPEGQTWRDLFDMVCGDRSLLSGCGLHRVLHCKQEPPVRVSLWYAAGLLWGLHPPCASLHLAAPQVIVNARKPDFFISSMSLYEVRFACQHVEGCCNGPCATH